MSQLRVHTLTLSLDGFVAGPDQSVDAPFGAGAMGLHDWIFATRTMRERFGQPGGTTGLDDDEVAAADDDIGATIIGRNMFGPVRGPWERWPDGEWTGWWGPTPPFGHDVFVLTHHHREPLCMNGGTTFHFIEASPHEALDRATEAADGLDVRLGGGAATIRQFLAAGLVDEIALVITPLLLGAGERLFDGIEGLTETYECDGLVPGERPVTHARLTRRR